MGFYIWPNQHTHFKVKDNVEAMGCIEKLKLMIFDPSDESKGAVLEMLEDQVAQDSFKEATWLKLFHTNETKFNIFEKFNSCDDYGIWIQTEDDFGDYRTEFIITIQPKLPRKCQH